MPTYANKIPGFVWLVAIMLAAVLLATMPARAEVASLEQAMQDITIGRPDAPVVMYEFSSLTCPHCAAFHSETLPALKKAYVDTGKLRIVFKDFPLDNLALAALMIARCSGPERSADFLNMLFDTQNDWGRSDNPRAALTTLARFYGMSASDVNACLTNQALADAILAERSQAEALYNINSTPSFVLGGEVLRGALPLEDFQAAIDKALNAAGAR